MKISIYKMNSSLFVGIFAAPPGKRLSHYKKHDTKILKSGKSKASNCDISRPD